MELDFQRIFKELSDEGIDYIVIGGLAVNLHGIPRMTYNIDLMILLNARNIKKLVIKLKSWGYLPRVPVQPEDLADEQIRNIWVREKNMKAFSFFSDKQPLGEIDLFIDSPIPYEEMRKRATILDLGGVNVPVISIPDLIELKLKSGRKQDLSDIEHLRSLLEE
jgi:predicted nucleotidyltransferase